MAIEQHESGVDYKGRRDGIKRDTQDRLRSDEFETDLLEKPYVSLSDYKIIKNSVNSEYQKRVRSARWYGADNVPRDGKIHEGCSYYDRVEAADDQKNERPGDILMRPTLEGKKIVLAFRVRRSDGKMLTIGYIEMRAK